MPSTRSSANWERRRITDSACVENTRKAPVNRATRASTVRLTRYARLRLLLRLSWSLSLGWPTVKRPGYSRSSVAASVRTKPARSTPSRSFRSTRESLPSRLKRHCSAAMSITARRWPLRARAIDPATRRGRSVLPARSTTRPPACTFSQAIAAGDRNSASSASMSLPWPAAGTPSRSGATNPARKASMPMIFKAPLLSMVDAGNAAAISSTGEATATPSTCARRG
jgi:hypothetical protein